MAGGGGWRAFDIAADAIVSGVTRTGDRRPSVVSADRPPWCWFAGLLGASFWWFAAPP
jgi:hypothetical protein